MPLVPPAGVLDPRIMVTLRRRYNCDLIIQAPSDASDGQGGSTRTWAPFVGPPNGELLGAVEALSSVEKEGQAAAGETSSHLVSFDYVAGVDATMRILFGTRIFDIVSVTDVNEQHLLQQVMVLERFRK